MSAKRVRGTDSPSVPDDKSGSPQRPDVACDSNLPEEDALGTLSYRDVEAPSSPSNSESSNQTGQLGSVRPCEFITDEMLAEENRLQTVGVAKEEERKREQEKDFEQMEEETREKRFERLKCLLNKSQLYTQYLVERIRTQKEEEEARRQRVLKRKMKAEQEKERQAQVEQESEVACETKKRKLDETTDSPTSPTKSKKKKIGTSPRSSPSSNLGADKITKGETEATNTTAADEQQEDPINNVTPTDVTKPTNGETTRVVEPGLAEKAATFGVDDDEERYTADGQLIPYLQPRLMDGGVLRPYQVDGYSWLKVLYENGVNGILADEMGLGKTVQCVAMLAHLVDMGIPGPYMVCAPLSTIPNWVAEFKRFAPRVPIILYHGDKDKRALLVKDIRRRCKIREKVYVQPVVITSYEIAMIDRRYLGNHPWKYLIVDEGHRIKNTHCRLIRELRMYNSTHRLLLTGTPLQNNLAELWSLLNFTLPEIFDDLGSFEAWFDAGSMNDAEESERLVQQERSDNVLRMLHQILTPFMLRRLKCDVDLKIPPKKEVLVYAPLTERQREMYSALIDRSINAYLDKDKETASKDVELNKSGRVKRKSAARPVNYSLLMESDNEKSSRKSGSTRRWRDLEAEEGEIEGWFEAVDDLQKSRQKGGESKKLGNQRTVQLRNIMMQLRKCCNHPYLIEHPVDHKTGGLALTEEVREVSGKMVLLDHMLPELKKRGHRVLIFSQMTRMLDLIEDYCYLRDYDYCRLDGSTCLEDRRSNMEDFNAGNSDKFLFLLSTRAGGLGINLTGADTVIIYDSDWNPQCDLQAQDRCHRIGQTKPVVVYRFVTANTIDQKIIERAAAKRKLEKIIIHKGSFKTGNFSEQAKPMSAEELQELLRSKDHDSEVKREKFTISKTEMDALLDRSDLYKKWGKQEEAATTKEQTTLPIANNPLALPRKTRGKKGKQPASKSKSPKSTLFEIVDNDAVSVTSCDTESETA